MMEHVRLNMDELEQYSKEELLERMKARYAHHSKACRVHAIAWMVFLLLLIVLYFTDHLTDWVLVIVPLLVGGSNLSDMLWYGKMSRCEDAKTLVELYDKGYKWGKVAAVLALVLVAFFLYKLVTDTIIENMGVVMFVTLIVLLSAFAFFMVNFVLFRHSIIKNKAIERLRELHSQENH